MLIKYINHTPLTLIVLNIITFNMFFDNYFIGIDESNEYILIVKYKYFKLYRYNSEPCKTLIIAVNPGVFLHYTAHYFTCM